MDIQQMWAEHGTTAIFVAAILIVGGIAWKLLSSRKPVFAEGMTLNVRCRSCNWQGTVTKYNQVCRKCNEGDLEHF